MQCRICNHDYQYSDYYEKDDPTVCDTCHMRLYGRFGHCGYGIKGVTDGPGSGNNQMCFNRPDIPKEMRLTFKRMEEAGKFKKHPELAAQAKMLLRNAEARALTERKLDYDKGDHPDDQKPDVEVSGDGI